MSNPDLQSQNLQMLCNALYNYADKMKIDVRIICLPKSSRIVTHLRPSFSYSKRTGMILRIIRKSRYQPDVLS